MAAIDTSTFLSDLGISTINTAATNQYEFYKGIVWSDASVTNDQYEFYQKLKSDTYRYGFYKTYTSEYSFYTTGSGDGFTDTNIVDFFTFYKYTAAAGVAPSSDADATAFLDAAGITDPTITDAINVFVIGLKEDSLWSKFLAIYPIVGGTADTHKYNLKDPRDLDAAFRITWAGGITHTSSGALFNGTTGYGNTNLNDDLGTISDKSVSLYCKTNSQEPNFDVGVTGGANGTNIALRHNSDNMFVRINASDSAVTTNSDSTGFYIATKDSSTTMILYKNASSIATRVQATSGQVAFPYFLGAVNATPAVATAWANREYCFFSFGTGMDATEASNYSSRVNTLQTTLGRNEY